MKPLGSLGTRPGTGVPETLKGKPSYFSTILKMEMFSSQLFFALMFISPKILTRYQIWLPCIFVVISLD